ncbi:hypothetical protein EPUS_06389 [Endocarpon pusillum Z07020]|uniref:PHD-type domain-containing protein n=1 Tax=Endocarpon pusillum (strain Z07020 / HMAS-L-300199) TaxID=1263415 RepID=U1HU24_ENDPU|nr:uncharacterized protein EPUS_06389 [Endocarpon pusillum Z07020]ERF74120.1 hypothetical protein EPUS_06389 [Endocarpon pusillum Z07020]
MGITRGTLEGAARPHFNPNTLSHRELLKPGPKVQKLRIRFSPYQELARVSLKRKRTANSSPAYPSLYSTQEGDQLSAQTEETQPTKKLKVIQHHFSKGEPVEEQFNTFQENFVNEETIAVDDGMPNGKDKGGLRANSTHQTYQARSGRRKPARRLYREKECTYPYESNGGEQLSGRVLRPRTKPKYYPDDEASDCTSDEHTAATVNTVDNQASNESEGVYSHQLYTGLACEYSGCHAKADSLNVASVSVPGDSENKNVGVDTVCRNWSLGCDYPTGFEITNSDQQASMNHQVTVDQARAAFEWQQTPLMNIREMITGICQDIDNLAEGPEIAGCEVVNDTGPAIHRGGQGEAFAEICAAPTSTSPRVSHIANGQVWESQATRKERARQELEAARPSACPTTTAATTGTSSNAIDPSLSAYNNDNNNNSFHLDGAASSTPNFTPTANTFPVPIGPNATTATNPTPNRFQNQDTHCLICLLPVTPSDILVSDLRCVACPRTFHQSCLTYIPPRINQNWRCSLCYREAWHGYGHLARELETRDPGLVERYRRRLLLANTYGGAVSMNAGLGQGGGRDEENVRFWFDVDMDGGAESDQAVLVRMGLVDMRMLRVLSDGDTSARVRSLEETERWGIALGMALQEEEGKVQELRGELERLRNVVEQKDREIEELEGGL